MNEAVAMAQTISDFEGIYASPQSSQSGSFSELGLTLLPSKSHQSGTSSTQNHGCGILGLHSGQKESLKNPKDISGEFKYPSSTSTSGLVQPGSSDDAPKHPVNLSNREDRKQGLSNVTNSSTAPLFVPLRPIDRSGRPNANSVTPTYITVPLQYRPSAPYLHALVSTGTTLAASAQLDHLKERNKHLTMERDRYYHLSKPATIQADDMKSEQIRQLQAELQAAIERNGQWALQHQTDSGHIQQLQAELRDVTDQNGRIYWALRHETARANHAHALAAQRSEECQKLMAAYNMLVIGNPFIPLSSQNPLPMFSQMPYPAGGGVSCQEIEYVDLTSPKRPSALQQDGLQGRGAPSSTTTPSVSTPTLSPASTTTLPAATTIQAPPAAPATPPPAKRPRAKSNNERQPPKEPASTRQRTNSATENQSDSGRPTKRQRTGSNPTEKQTRKQQSMLNRSNFDDIQARVRSALKGKSGSYAWLQEKESNEVEYAHGAKVMNGGETAEGVKVSGGAQVASEVETPSPASTAEEDELSDSEVAEFDKALQEAWDEVEDEDETRVEAEVEAEVELGALMEDEDGDDESLFGDLVVLDN